MIEDSPHVALLDDGFIRLVDSMGDDQSILRATRVSTGSVARKAGDDRRLINFLMQNGHTSPFEHAAFTFHIRAPRFVMDEWMRHRTWSYNAQSQRYMDLSEKLSGYLPDLDRIGKQPPPGHNQQGRLIGEVVDEDYADLTRACIAATYEAAFASYREMIKEGVPRELARLVMPMGLYTEWFATVDLWNLLHFIRLRSAPSAQYEIRVYSDAIQGLIRPLVPLSFGAFRRHVLGKED